MKCSFQPIIRIFPSSKSANWTCFFFFFKSAWFQLFLPTKYIWWYSDFMKIFLDCIKSTEPEREILSVCSNFFFISAIIYSAAKPFLWNDYSSVTDKFPIREMWLGLLVSAEWAWVIAQKADLPAYGPRRDRRLSKSGKQGVWTSFGFYTFLSSKIDAKPGDHLVHLGGFSQEDMLSWSRRFPPTRFCKKKIVFKI